MSNQIEVWKLNYEEKLYKEMDMAIILGALLRQEEAVLDLDPYIPLPQNSCCFKFSHSECPGTDLPLTVGLAFHLWNYHPEFKGTCPYCDGKILTVGFGGLLSMGGFIGICSGCGTGHFSFKGGLGVVRRIVMKKIEGSGYEVTGALFGGCYPGDRAPLYKLLKALGETELPPVSWIYGMDESASKLDHLGPIEF